MSHIRTSTHRSLLSAIRVLVAQLLERLTEIRRLRVRFRPGLRNIFLSMRLSLSTKQFTKLQFTNQTGMHFIYTLARMTRKFDEYVWRHRIVITSNVTFLYLRLRRYIAMVLCVCGLTFLLTELTNQKLKGQLTIASLIVGHFEWNNPINITRAFFFRFPDRLIRLLMCSKSSVLSWTS